MPKLVPLILLFAPAAAFAGLSSPNSHILISPDRSRLLVMISGDPTSDQTPTVTLPNGRILNLRATFKKSGCYDAQSFAPLWQADWFAFDYELICSNDFRSIARLNRFGQRSMWAIRFYKDGNSIKSYEFRQL